MPTASYGVPIRGGGPKGANCPAEDLPRDKSTHPRAAN
jgi:hypothetical protein